MNSQNVINTPKNRTNSPPLNSHNLTNKTNSPHVNSQTKSPYVNSQTNSPFINSQTKSPAVNSRNMSDKHGRGNYHFTPSPASPGIPSPQQLTRERPKVLEERQEVVHHKHPTENQREHNRSGDNYRPLFHDDDDKILDITRLRMLPKLL
jgi:hypothetical protein